MPLNAARLRHRIDVQQVAETPDGAGGKSKSWSTFAPAIFAEVVALNGGEAFAQGVARNTQMYRVTIRYRSDIGPRNRILWNEQILNIRTCAEHPDHSPREALLMTAESGAPEA